MAKTIVVLSDGESWSRLSGASLLVVSDAEYNALQKKRTSITDLNVIAEIGLTEAFAAEEL